MVEPHIKDVDKTHIPDLVFLRDSEAVVIDPFVFLEFKIITFFLVASAHFAKYLPMVDDLKYLTGCSSMSMYGFEQFCDQHSFQFLVLTTESVRTLSFL